MASATAPKIKAEAGGHIAMLVPPKLPRPLNGSLVKLASLAPPRDLTLGGRGGSTVPKKVFTPNLNVVRNKNTNVKTSRDMTVTRGRGRGARGAGRGRGARGGLNPGFIQTTGLFSEGAGALPTRKTTSGHSSNYTRNTDETPSSMRKPVLTKQEPKSLDLKAEAAMVREALGDSDDDDLLDEKTDMELIPVRIGEVAAKPKFVNAVIKLEKIEEELQLNGDLNNKNVDAIGIAAKLQSLFVQHQDKQLEQAMSSMNPLSNQALSLDDIFTSTESPLFIMQMPNTLPCDGDIEADDLAAFVNHLTKDGKLIPPSFGVKPSISANAKNALDKPSTSAASTAKVTDLPSESRLPVFKNHLVLANATNYDLTTMEEGQVGKLLRYKSGKVKLMLGDALFDLDMGTDPGFVQDIMSINTNREERSGNVINLGPLQAKITASPDCQYYRKETWARYGA